MLTVHNSFPFVSCFWDRKKMARENSSYIELLEKSEDDRKLHSNLDLMLLSLAVDENDPKSKEADVTLREALYGLIEQIQKAAKTTFDNQTVSPSARLQKELDMSSLGVLMDRMNRRRLQDQVSNTMCVCMYVNTKK